MYLVCFFYEECSDVIPSKSLSGLNIQQQNSASNSSIGKERRVCGQATEEVVLRFTTSSSPSRDTEKDIDSRDVLLQQSVLLRLVENARA